MTVRKGMERLLAQYPYTTLIGCTALIGAGLVGVGNHIQDHTPKVLAQPLPTVTETVTASPDISNGIRVTEPIIVTPYHILSDTEGSPAVDNSTIDKNIKAAYRYLRYDFEDLVEVSAEPTQTIRLQPEGREIISDANCFTDGQLGKLATRLREKQPNSSQTIVALVMDKVDQCETTNDDGSVRQEADNNVATASAGGITVKSNVEGIPYIEPEVFLHETGHMLGVGLGHVGEIDCNSSKIPLYDPYDPALEDIQDILDKSFCDFTYMSQYDGSDPTTTRSRDVPFMKKINPYTGYGSVMGYSGNWDEDRLRNAITPAYSNFDRSTVLPEVFQIETVEPEPGTYTLAYEPHKRNGIKFKLSAEHPLVAATGDAKIDELVITVEGNGGGVTVGEEYKNPRRCDDQLSCGITLYANSSTTGFRIELPSTHGYFDQDTEKGAYKSVLYLDKALGLGIVGNIQLGDSTAVEVVDYQTALKYSRIQKAIAALYHEEMKRDDIRRLRNSKELHIATGALVL